MRVLRASRGGRSHWRIGIAAAVAAAFAALAVSVDGRPASAPMRPPDYGSQPAPSLFGVNTGTYDRDVARLELGTPMAAALGATWVHFTAGSLTFSGNRVGFAVLDRSVAQARAYHLGVLVSLGGVPAACSLRPRPAQITSCPPTSAADLRAYDAFLRTLLLNLRGSVEYFESWVEPNHASMWQPSPSAAAYATLLLNEYQTVQAINRRYGLDDKLLFAGIGGSDLGYLAKVLNALHGRRAFDLVGDAPYRFPPTPPSTPNYALSFPGGGHPKLTWAQELTDYEGEFTSHGYGSPQMWLTEFGWPGVPTAAQSAAAGPPSPNPNCNYRDSPPTLQEQILQTAYQILRQLGFVKGAFWENERDYQKGDPNPDPACFAYYGLLDTNFDPKPAGEEFEELSSQAEQAEDPAGPPPTFDATAAASTVRGTVTVEAPATTVFVPLVGARPILVGSIVSATDGVVRITIATKNGKTQSAVFYGGQFKLEQTRSGAAELILDAPLACGAHSAADGPPRRKTRRLWGDGHGDFTTIGSYASATVLGTKWLTVDTCTSTRVTVATGMVRVKDFVRHRSLVLRAPHTYIAQR